MTYPLRPVFVRSTLVLLLVLNLGYVVDAALSMAREFGTHSEYFQLTVSALSQQLGWIVLLVYVFYRLDRRFPVLLAIAVGMFTGNFFCSLSKWIDGLHREAFMNSAIGLALCGIVVLAAVVPLALEGNRAATR